MAFVGLRDDTVTVSYLISVIPAEAGIHNDIDNVLVD